MTEDGGAATAASAPGVSGASSVSYAVSRPAGAAAGALGSEAAKSGAAQPQLSGGEQGFALAQHAASAQVHYRGTLIDLGSPAANGRIGPWWLTPDANLVDSEHDGATWTRVFARTLSVQFTQEEAAPLLLAMRTRGGAARVVTALLDGRTVASMRMLRGEIRVLGAHLMTTPLAPGLHTLMLKFSGAARPPNDPFAEIDWIRLGSDTDDGTTYHAPTMNELVVNASLAGVPHRSIALRGPASAGFAIYVSPSAHLRTAVGFEGGGHGTGDVVLVAEDDAPVNLGAFEVTGGEAARWKVLDVPLSDWADKLVTLKLRARQTTPGGRLLFGDPTIFVPPRAPTPTWPEARLAVVVVLSSVDRAHLLSTNHQAFPALEQTATSFDRHRLPSTVSAAVMASLLTGLPPRAHALEDGGARLPDSLTMLSSVARDASVQPAMFTACPTTFAAFGFARGWDKYATYSPVEGTAAVAPIQEAAQWVASHMKLPEAKALVLIHARGGHPPWDVTAADAAKLPPFDYSGAMEPRRSAQMIARARGRRSRVRLSEGDRARMWAIYEQALLGHDRAIGDLIDVLRRHNLWDKTLFVVTGDTGLVADSKAPFGDGDDLAEAGLTSPLWIHFPGGLFGGTHVTTPTQVVDISKTVIDALHLGTREDFQGEDLLVVASGAVVAGGRPQWATVDQQFSTRLGDLALIGSPGRAPVLCDLRADPSCDVDRAEKLLRATSALWRATYDAELAAQKLRKRQREPATVDPDTAAALQVWGE